MSKSCRHPLHKYGNGEYRKVCLFPFSIKNDCHDEAASDHTSAHIGVNALQECERRLGAKVDALVYTYSGIIYDGL